MEKQAKKRRGRGFSKGKAIVVLAAGMLIGATFVSPAGAHVSDSATHLWSTHIKPLALKLFYTKAQVDNKFVKKSGPQDYCWNAEKYPRSFSSVPCISTGITLDSSGDVGRNSSVTIGADGNPLVAYLDRIDGDLELIHCTVPGCSESDPAVTLDNGTNVGYEPSIAVGEDGMPVIAYYSGSNGNLKLVHCTSADCSSVSSPRTLVSTGDVGRFPTIAIGTDGFPLISYASVNRSTVEFLRCTAVDCSSADAPRTLAFRAHPQTDMAIGVDSNPVITFKNFSNNGLKLIHCTAGDCSTRDSVRTLDTYPGDNSSVAIGTDGFPIVAYTATDVSALAVIHCTRVDCLTRSTQRSLVSGSKAGFGGFPSIVIGADGYPAVSYTNYPNGELLFVRCANASCSSRGTMKTLDNVGEISTVHSLVTGTDGRQLISYYDGVSEDLKVIQVK